MGPLRPLLILLALTAAGRLLGTLIGRLRFLPAARDGQAEPPRVERCVHCNAYAPLTEGHKSSAGAFYCCREHAEAARDRTSAG